MCSTDYEMLVSHTSPLFTHSPPTGRFLTEYAALRLEADTFPRSVTHKSFHPIQHSNSWSNFSLRPLDKLSRNPVRPCIVVRGDKETRKNMNSTLSSKLKKRVVFADDKGLSLTHVRVMTEPSNAPPLWSLRFLTHVTHNLDSDSVETEPTWEITFPQPASDYVSFRKKLDEQKVSLENVIIKEVDELMSGTIKVKNEEFNKEVFVRSSFDDWKTYKDFYSTFVPNNLNSKVSAAYVLYDTFSLTIRIPPKTTKIEFCVCFKCGGIEYWDNNNGKNYLIIKKNCTGKKLLCVDRYKEENVCEQQVISKKCLEVTETRMDSWSEFASWTHLENSNPYW